MIIQKIIGFVIIFGGLLTIPIAMLLVAIGVATSSQRDSEWLDWWNSSRGRDDK